MTNLSENIKVVNLIPLATIAATGLDGSETPADMQADVSFDTALVAVTVGAFTGTPTTVAISVVEGDLLNMSDATVIEGGTSTAVLASTLTKFQVHRKKRYIGVTVTITGGTTPTAQVSALGILTNWAVPFPVI